MAECDLGALQDFDEQQLEPQRLSRHGCDPFKCVIRAVVILSALIACRSCCTTVINDSFPPADGGSTLPLFIPM
jgi:hypothetical protein